MTEINQNYAPAYFHKARLLTNADDFEEARKNYETALDIDEKFAEAHYYLGKLLSGGVATDKEGTLVDKTDLPQAKNTIFKSSKSTQDTQKPFTTWPRSYRRKKTTRLPRSIY